MLTWGYPEAATGLSIPTQDQGLGVECVLNPPLNSLQRRSFQNIMVALPSGKGGLGLRLSKFVTDHAFIGSIEMFVPFFTGINGL